MNEKVAVPLKKFLLIENCPAEWKDHDLYLFRDDEVVFYAGQSYLAFARVWDHLKGGFKGHSIVGRFIWANWPRSMKFTIEFMCSRSEEFNIVQNDLSAAERQLIQQWTPCFNVSLNSQPTPIPSGYLPYNARLHCGELNKLIHQAERTVKADEAAELLQELEQVDPLIFRR